ncbi:MAG: DUF3276 family protein, partial [Candidatus Sigynarchaeota archaeon]
DVAVPVKAGDAITCNLKQVRNFWNGKNLRVVDAKTAVVTPFPGDAAASTPTATTPAASTVVMEPTQPGESSQVIKAGSRTYAVDVKIGKNGQKYMTITESGGKDGETHRIMVFADHVDDFVDAVEKARKAMK